MNKVMNHLCPEAFVMCCVCLYLFSKGKIVENEGSCKGGGPAPANLTWIEEAVVHIYGNTPEFAGVVQKIFGESRLVMKRGKNTNDL